jgi:hypothetical protein
MSVYFSRRLNTYLCGIGRLKPGVWMTAARQGLDIIAARLGQA